MLFPHQQIFRIFVAFLACQTLITGNIVQAKETSVLRFYHSSVELAQANQEELMLNQMNQSMTSAFNDIPIFINDLNQIESAAQNDQQLNLLLQKLIPMATRITGNFAQAHQIGQQINAMIPANTQEALIMNQILTINSQGAATFAGWIDVFVPMQQALQTQNANQFETAASQLPNVINQTTMFMHVVQNFAQGYNNNQTNTTPSNNNQMTLDQINQLSNISTQMHNTNMNIINNMGGGGEWRYNPATGQDEWISY